MSTPINTKNINVKNQDFLPVYLGYIFIALSIPTDFFGAANIVSFPTIFSQRFDAVDLQSIATDEYDKIKYIALYRDDKYYVQNVTPSVYLKKATISFGGVVEYHSDTKQIIIQPIPNCIYDIATDTLYFQQIEKAYQIFGDLKIDYKQATAPQVNEFMGLDLLEVAEDLTADNVSTPNRKLITAVKEKVNNYTPQQKAELTDYMRESLNGRIPFENGRFKIESDKDLKAILYGIQQRFYTTPVDHEKKAATGFTDANNI